MLERFCGPCRSDELPHQLADLRTRRVIITRYLPVELMPDGRFWACRRALLNGLFLRELSGNPPSAHPEEAGIEQGVTAQSIGAMHRNASDLAGGEEPWHRGSAPSVGEDAAHEVMHRWLNGDRMAPDVGLIDA